MGKKINIGNCSICGERCALSYEHVPPKKAFNNMRVNAYSIDEMLSGSELPWDMTGKKAKILQKGSGAYTLCDTCNNNTGTWYGKDYVDFISGIHNAISQHQYGPGASFQIEATDVYPLRIFKQILAMFCSVNGSGFGEDFHEYLLNKENCQFDVEKYKLSIYICGQVHIQTGICVKGDISTNSFRTVSEIAHYPLGYVLDFDTKSECSGCDITTFSQCAYEQKANVILTLPVLEHNTGFPLDYRSKSEIIDCIEESKKHTELEDIANE